MKKQYCVFVFVIFSCMIGFGQTINFRYDKNGNLLSKHKIGTIPIVDITGDTLICKNNFATLTAHGGLHFLWSTSDTTSTIRKSIDTSTIYFVDVLNGSGCNSRKYITVKVNDSLCSNTESICPKGNTTFSLQNISGASSFQWQVDVGSGFTNISNNLIYSGVNSTILNLDSVPSTYYGYKYRCLYMVNSTPFYGPVHTLKFAAIWTGTLNTDWDKSENWNCGVIPDLNTDVIIQANTLNFPDIKLNVIIRSLEANAQSSIYLEDGYTLTLTGH